MEQQLYDQIESYLAQTLSPEDQQAFEKQLETDPGFAAEVSQYLQIKQGIQNNGRDQIRDWVAKEYQQYKIQQNKTNTPIRLMKNYWWVAAAAVIALIFLLRMNIGNTETSLPDMYALNYVKPDINFMARDAGDSNQNNLDSLKVRALLFYQANQYDSAIYIFEQVQQDSSHQSDAEVQYLVGMCLLELNQTTEAIHSLNLVKQSNSNLRGNAEWYIALAHIKNNDAPAAIKALRYLLDDSNQGGHSPKRKKQARQMLEFLEGLPAVLSMAG